MGRPAARLTDMHLCPRFTGHVPHVGGPIIARGTFNVLIGNLTSAQVGDKAICIGPPDTIAPPGAPTVLIGGRPAARLGDATVHGGRIIFGCFTVWIGNQGASGSGVGGVLGAFLSGTGGLFPETCMKKAKAAAAAFMKSGKTSDSGEVPAESGEGAVGAADGTSSGGSQVDPTVELARSYVGSHNWSYVAYNSPYRPGTNKCNLFVYEVLNKSGKPVPTQEHSRRLWGKVEYPPLAGQWADPNYKIPGWEVVTDPMPGDVAAIQQQSVQASGHVAIVTGPNSTVSATSFEGVVERNWGFRDGQKPVFRRYTGN